MIFYMWFSSIFVRCRPKVWFARCEWNFSKSDLIFFWKWILQPANQTFGWQYYSRTHVVWRFCYKTRESYIFDSAAVFKIYYRNWKSHSPSPTCWFVSGSIFAIHGYKATLQFAFLNLLRRHLSTLPLLPSVLHCDRLRSGRAGLSLTGAFKLTKEPDLKIGKSKVSLDLECTFNDMVSYLCAFLSIVPTFQFFLLVRSCSCNGVWLNRFCYFCSNIQSFVLKVEIKMLAFCLLQQLWC